MQAWNIIDDMRVSIVMYESLFPNALQSRDVRSGLGAFRSEVVARAVILFWCLRFPQQ